MTAEHRPTLAELADGLKGKAALEQYVTLARKFGKGKKGLSSEVAALLAEEEDATRALSEMREELGLPEPSTSWDEVKVAVMLILEGHKEENKLLRGVIAERNKDWPDGPPISQAEWYRLRGTLARMERGFWAKLSMGAVARQMGIGVVEVSDMERGKVNPRSLEQHLRSLRPSLTPKILCPDPTEEKP